MEVVVLLPLSRMVGLSWNPESSKIGNSPTNERTNERTNIKGFYYSIKQPVLLPTTTTTTAVICSSCSRRRTWTEFHNNNGQPCRIENNVRDREFDSSSPNDICGGIFPKSKVPYWLREEPSTSSPLFSSEFGPPTFFVLPKTNPTLSTATYYVRTARVFFVHHQHHVKKKKADKSWLERNRTKGYVVVLLCDGGATSPDMFVEVKIGVTHSKS